LGLLGLASCPAPNFDETACVEDYGRPADLSVGYSGDADVRLLGDAGAVSIEIDEFEADSLDPQPPWTFLFPLVGDRRTGGELPDFAVRQVTVDVDEGGGVVIDVVNDAGALTFHAGDVPPAAPAAAAIVAEDRAVRDGPCAADSARGHFAGVELRDIDTPLVLSAGTDADIAIGGETYVAGAPWAFVNADGIYDGWAYIWRHTP
jgi:hypothetical protein